jgi:pyruvate/oxaloacetate carboxyltransferase
VQSHKQFSPKTPLQIRGYYGEPVVSIDPKVMDRVMSSPRTEEFLDWKPEGYLKTVEELRGEIGPELSDDDLLLRIVIPGVQLKRGDSKKQATRPTTKATRPVSLSSTDFPTEYDVEVNGEAFSVKISPILGGTGKTHATVQAPTIETAETRKKH